MRASAIGGAGNGIQWVGVMTAVQQLTAPEHQARVISLLEALAKAMPATGFLLGGALGDGARDLATSSIAANGRSGRPIAGRWTDYVPSRWVCGRKTTEGGENGHHH
jgi:hypothetical protein